MHTIKIIVKASTLRKTQLVLGMWMVLMNQAPMTERPTSDFQLIVRTQARCKVSLSDASYLGHRGVRAIGDLFRQHQTWIEAMSKLCASSVYMFVVKDLFVKIGLNI